MNARERTRIELGSNGSLRQRILTAAREVALQRGYSAFSMEAVASRAAVARRTVYNQFQDRESLYRSVMLELVEIVEEQPAPHLARYLPLAAAARTFCAQARAILGSDAYQQLRWAIERDGPGLPWLEAVVERRLIFPLRVSMQSYLLYLAAEGTLSVSNIESLCQGLIRVIELGSIHRGENSPILEIDELTNIVISRIAPSQRLIVSA